MAKNATHLMTRLQVITELRDNPTAITKVVRRDGLFDVQYKPSGSSSVSIRRGLSRTPCLVVQGRADLVADYLFVKADRGL